MTIIIATQNERFFMEQMRTKTLNVIGKTAHTMHVKLSQKRFNTLYQRIKESGNNPYALMSW